MGQTLLEKFEQRVAIVPFSTCHYWAGQVNDSGYGLLSGRRASHISHELFKGPVPKTIDGRRAMVRHKCDTPLCVNPDHLILGTDLQNVQDAVDRDRVSRGERHCHAKLKNGDAEDIIAAVNGGESVTAVAARYGIAPSRVSTIRYGRSRWCEVEKPTGRSDRRISDETARTIYAQAHHSGLTQREIAQEHGVTVWMVADIKRGATYANVTGHGG